MRSAPPWLTIILTFLLAIFLMIIPLPLSVMWLRPIWILIALIYWSMMYPYHINFGTAWCLGLLLDILNGSLLGEHALALTVALYFIIRKRTQFQMYPIMQQSLGIFMSIFIYLLILFVTQSFTSVAPKSIAFWSPALTSMMFWPLIISMMRPSHKKI